MSWLIPEAWSEVDREFLELVNNKKKRTKFVDETDPNYFPITEDSSGQPFYIEPDRPVRARAKGKQEIDKPKEKKEEPTILQKIVSRKKRKKQQEEGEVIIS